jgi:hypothetical protein
MKYIYDILLNFNDERIYEFYEWSDKDEIEYFKKVPLFMINNKTFDKINIGNIIDDHYFLEKIYNISEVYDNKMIRKAPYICIFTDSNRVIGTFLNKNGEIMMMSKLLIDEEEEAIEIGNTMKEIQINIVQRKQIKESFNYLTRNESYRMYFLNKEINNLYQTKNIVKLKYLYYECSNQIADDIDIIYNYLKTFLNSEWNIKHNSLYDLVRLSYSKNNY